jgi:hypothetical protein
MGDISSSVPLFITKFRAATAGKAPKARSLPGFCRIESGGGSGGKPLMWPPLWGPCLPKIGHGGPEITSIIFFDKGIHSSVLFIVMSIYHQFLYLVEHNSKNSKYILTIMAISVMEFQV